MNEFIHGASKHKVTRSAPRSQTNKNVFSSGWTVPDSWSSCREISIAQSSIDPWDDAQVGVDRTKMTAAPRVVGDELAFLRQ